MVPMPLHPQSEFVLKILAASGIPAVEQTDPATARALRKAGRATLAAMAGPFPELARIENHTIPGPERPLDVRLYWPKAAAPLPMVVYFHGGGWVLGDLETHDGACRALAHASGSIVASVDYRLAPEHPFPAAVHDAFAATAYLAQHGADFDGDSSRLAVAGDSAGGNLAAVVAQLARDRGGPQIAFQLLIYPATDYKTDWPSLREYAEGCFLTRAGMDWFLGHYLPDPSQGHNPLFAPLKAQNLANLPPAMIITAECDPIRDEGEAYGRKLQEAGVPVNIKRYDGAIHGFFQMGGMIDSGKQAMADAGAALRDAFGLCRATRGEIVTNDVPDPSGATPSAHSV